MKKYILLLCCAALLTGCAEWGPSSQKNRNLLEPLVAIPSFSSNYLMSCLNDMQTMRQEEFDTKFKLAGENLQNGRKMDSLYYICLSLTDQADYEQLKQGLDVLELYLEEYPDSGEGMQGFQYLAQRLDREITNRHSVRKALTGENEALHTEVGALQTEVASLKVRLEEQDNQIEQLKNIENIIKNRETEQP